MSMTRGKSKTKSKPMITETELHLRQLEQRMREQIGPLERSHPLWEDEKGRVIKFFEHYLEANSNSVRDQAIRYYVLDRMKFSYNFG